jgi:hypothetical protein
LHRYLSGIYFHRFTKHGSTAGPGPVHFRTQGDGPSCRARTHRLLTGKCTQSKILHYYDELAAHWIEVVVGPLKRMANCYDLATQAAMTIKTIWLGEHPSAPAAKPSFAELRPSGSKRILHLLSSLGLHVTAVWLLGSTVEAVNARRASIHKEYPSRSLQLSAAYVVSAPHLAAPAGFGSPATAHPAEYLSGEPAASVAETAASSTPTRVDPVNAEEQTLTAPQQQKRFQLPIVTSRKPASQILVRIDIPPDLKLDPQIAVPKILLWQLPAPQRPKEDLVAAAHREEQPVVERQTSAVKPQLIDRNQEKELAELRHAAAPPVPVAVVPLPVANTTPIQLLAGIQGNRMPNSTGPVVQAPEEVHVISVPEVPIPQPRVIVLPLGNQGTPPPGRAGAGGGNGRSNSVDAGTGSTGAIANYGKPGLGGESVGSANGGTSPPPPNTILITRPKDGRYNVVVLGSTNLDAYPEAAGLLSGKLVYTVYIRAGGRKEWILQYCLPKSVEQTIKLRGSAVPVEAPYPFVIYRPNLTLLNDFDYLIVHGFINPAGRFEHLLPLGDIDSAGKELLIGALEHWEFRPASRDGVPSAVEVALIIPREPI